MASLATSWEGDEHIVSPVLSSTPSFVSVRSAFSDTPQWSPGIQIQEAFRATESQTKGTSSRVIELSGGTTNTYREVGTSFVRHKKYFFQDGNITFLIDGTLYCVHRYFFSRDSAYFSTQFTRLDIRDHETFHTTISFGDIKREDFDALLSVLYPEAFEENDFSYEQWKSVLHLATRWGFASIRRLALNSISPPTPHDRLLLARTYSIDHWVVPALSALCERKAPLTLSEARQMDVEDIILVATVREAIRSHNHKLQVDGAEIPRHVEAAQAGRLSYCEDLDFLPSIPRKGTVEQASPPDPEHAAKQGAHRNGGERPARLGVGQRVDGIYGQMEPTRVRLEKKSVGAGEQPHAKKDARQGSPEEVTAIHATEAKTVTMREATTAIAHEAKIATTSEAKAVAVHEAEAATPRAEGARATSPPTSNTWWRKLAGVETTAANPKPSNGRV